MFRGREASSGLPRQLTLEYLLSLASATFLSLRLAWYQVCPTGDPSCRARGGGGAGSNSLWGGGGGRGQGEYKPTHQGGGGGGRGQGEYKPTHQAVVYTCKYCRLWLSKPWVVFGVAISTPIGNERKHT